MSRPGPSTGRQPLSFKTVPNRNKTQKWQQARQYNYDGDDWGGYDPYDEYGSGYDDPAAPTAIPQPQRYGSEPPQGAPLNRQTSFDRGIDSERRQFSGPPGYMQQERRGSPAMSNSSGSRPSADYERRARERNFTNPEQVPPPLNTRVSPGPSGGRFPPRKSSISSSPTGTPPPVPAPETMPAKTQSPLDKPLPFIRPSDIYRRMAEEKERERQSMDSSRPSLDSIQRDAQAASPPVRSTTDSPASSGLGRRPSLEPVVEHNEHERLPPSTLPSVVEQRASGEMQPDVSPDITRDVQTEPEYKPLSSLPAPSLGTSTFGEPEKTSKEASPVLPEVSRVSGFGMDFFNSNTDDAHPTADENEQTPTSPPHPHVDSTISRVMNAPVTTTSTSQDTAFSSLQATPTAGTASEAEDQLSNLPEHADKTQQSDLHHAPSNASQGFRSVVNTAFDRKDDSSVPPTPISRDNSQSASGSDGVSRSDTNSTSGISPIMSRVPSAATAQQRQQVPPIAEEPSSAHPPTQQTQPRPLSGQFSIARKPSLAGHSRNSSGETTKGIVQPGYRRSLDPPSHGSPAR
jgi:hypothetical protein